MKVKLGGTVSFNVIPKSYESVSANATFEIEKEVDEKEYNEAIEELQLKIKRRLENEIEIYIKTSLQQYAKTKKTLQKIMAMEDSEI